jgi:hypothetical protein
MEEHETTDHGPAKVAGKPSTRRETTSHPILPVTPPPYHPSDTLVRAFFPSAGRWIEAEHAQAHCTTPTLQTHVYAIYIQGTSLIKIGYSRKPEERLRTLHSFMPFDMGFFGLWVVPHQDVEGQLHARFQHCHKRGEWFDMDDNDRALLVHIMGVYERRA